MFKYFFIHIILLISLVDGLAQSGLATDSVKNISIKVDSILILGNKITEPDIILRELTFAMGDSVSYEQLKFNRERIYSLGIFNRVELNITEESHSNILIISVEESWYIYPIPFVELEDKD